LPSFLIPVKTIIHYTISEETYADFILSCDFTEFFCPCCGAAVRYHATYSKYLYQKIIQIHRVMCLNTACRKTHAIIPSFSVPCCSIGSKELDSFIRARNEGKSVDQAGQCFIEAGMSPDYPESIHKRLKSYIDRITLIFQPLIPHRREYSATIIQLAGEDKPSLVLSCMCAKRGFNPVLFSRKNILIVPKKNVGAVISPKRPFRVPP
jgi:hypothetical protein